ncbi:outer membrane protein OmpA [Limnobacter sp. 130]|jgi:OOP family OmpA-OmpF porin|uniref:outer membrane protein OmpA n=1 Tax=unclassified Limnobacter TaxID=2630203 RepID=UPI0012EFCF73|nr:OmpA family protein [Limnobacter sp. 130]VWX33402.1 Outer membrane protein A [Limnobacter sp. 130]
MKKMSTLTQVLMAMAIGTASTAAMAHTTDKGEGLSGYVVDGSGKVVKDGSGECIRTSYFTAALAIQECDPDLIPKKPAPAPVAAPAPAPEPAPTPVITKVSLEADAYFDFDKATLKQGGKDRIDSEITKLGQVDLNSVIAIGHTDSIGSDAYNQKLSERRAQAVKDYMVSKGVAADRIQIKGMGESQPVADNKTREGRAKNRRVEIEFNATQKVVK